MEAEVIRCVIECIESVPRRQVAFIAAEHELAEFGVIIQEDGTIHRSEHRYYLLQNRQRVEILQVDRRWLPLGPNENVHPLVAPINKATTVPMACLVVTSTTQRVSGYSALLYGSSWDYTGAELQDILKLHFYRSTIIEGFLRGHVLVRQVSVFSTEMTFSFVIALHYMTAHMLESIGGGLWWSAASSRPPRKSALPCGTTSNTQPCETTGARSAALPLAEAEENQRTNQHAPACWETARQANPTLIIAIKPTPLDFYQIMYYIVRIASCEMMLIINITRPNLPPFTGGSRGGRRQQR